MLAQPQQQWRLQMARVDTVLGIEREALGEDTLRLGVAPQLEPVNTAEGRQSGMRAGGVWFACAHNPSASWTRVSELSTEPEPALRSISFFRRSTRPSSATSRASPVRWLYFCLSRSCPRFSRAPTGLTAFALLDGAFLSRAICRRAASDVPS